MFHELLRNARAIQAERGHNKDSLTGADGSVCIGQALRLGQRQAFQPVLPLGDLRDDLAQALGFESAIQMVLWNNEPERTLGDVLECFDRAIEATAPELSASTLTTPELALA